MENQLDNNVSNDIIINVNDYYVKKIKIGQYGICEIPNGDTENIVRDYVGNVFLKTKFKEFLWVRNRKTVVIESENIIRNMWFCKILSYNQLLEITNLKDISPPNDFEDNIEVVNIIYARCNSSMIFLDKVYRDYIYKHKFNTNEIVAIKSVAGSGKTTTLLELAKIHNKKKILYIAFNKSLITEIKDKIITKKLNNLYPSTFDALMREVFISRTNIEYPEIVDLKPHTLPNIIEWFKTKPYRIKNFYIKNYNKFCNQVHYEDINQFSKKVLGDDKKLLKTMWDKTLKFKLITFDSIRKIVEMNHWCKDYIDKKYDMIFIDESQDFDNTMLKILLEDTTIPKLFVGDTRQAIYEWKGCINAFDKLPSSSLVFEFYSTFRVGMPACEEITQKFDNCNMISKSNNTTIFEYDTVPDEKYTYLFRNWKNLLQSAQYISDIWINNFESQIEYIKRLHSKLQKSSLEEDELNEFADDLPKFLLKLSLDELERLINNIEKNVVEKKDCKVEMYTIHSYKGLEDDIIRVYNDIDIQKEENLYYVALTRAKKRIILDIKIPIYDDITNNKKQSFIGDFYK